MENITNRGVYFNKEDIKGIVEKYLDWAELAEDQTFYAENIMNDDTPIGTSIIVGVDGIKAEDGSDILRLVLSSGIYELPVKLTTANDALNLRFDKTIPIPGTYGQILNGELDILTDEEKDFKSAVEEQLGNRDDEYAEAFHLDNIRIIGGRSLILLEKIKSEIKNDNILSHDGVTPAQLVAVFIEVTEKYIKSLHNVETLTEKHDALYQTYKDTFEEDSKPTKKLAREIEGINKMIDTNRQIADFCLATIHAAINPVLAANVAR